MKKDLARASLGSVHRKLGDRLTEQRFQRLAEELVRDVERVYVNHFAGICRHHGRRRRGLLELSDRRNHAPNSSAAATIHQLRRREKLLRLGPVPTATSM